MASVHLSTLSTTHESFGGKRSSPTTKPSDDYVLAQCLLYWYSESITSSFWLYYSRKLTSDDGDFHEISTTKVTVPTGVGFGKLLFYIKYEE